jgi:hypothetical protein
MELKVAYSFSSKEKPQMRAVHSHLRVSESASKDVYTWTGIDVLGRIVQCRMAVIHGNCPIDPWCYTSVMEPA